MFDPSKKVIPPGQFWENFPKTQLGEIGYKNSKLPAAVRAHFQLPYDATKGGTVMGTKGVQEPDIFEPASESRAWLRAESSEALAGINEECLELLAAQSMVRTSHPQPILSELADLWRSLDARARRRAAECPYLLVDAGFADARRWRFLNGQVVSEPAVGSTNDGPPFFTAPGASDVTRRVLQFARELALTNDVAARLWVAMPPHCTQLLAACTLRDIDMAAARHPAWLMPRWARHVRVWRVFLMAARSGDVPAMQLSRMHGIQLLAGELQSAMTPSL
jgi:hypothetical protein